MKKEQQFTEIQTILKEAITSHKELEDTMFSEVKDVVPLELVTYRFIDALQSLGYVQLADSDDTL